MTTRLPSTGRCGKVRGLWPVAMMMLSALTFWALPSAFVTVTVFASTKVAVPDSTVILFFFIRNSTPLAIAPATSRERLITAAKSARTLSAASP